MNPQNGKGSAPRKGADSKKYSNNWEKIFSKPNLPVDNSKK
jgi:hypothetical protein